MTKKQVNTFISVREKNLKPGYYWANYMEPNGCVYGPDIVEVSNFQGVSDVYALGKRSNINLCSIEFLCEIVPPVNYAYTDPLSIYSEKG